MTELRPELSPTPLADEFDLIAKGLERTRFDPALKFQAEDYDPAIVLKVIEQWRYRMVFEHRSSTVFSQLAEQLFEANASLDAKVVMMRMAQDELRHTKTCADVIVGLGGEAVSEADLVVERIASHEGTSREECAIRNVIYTTCCSEMVACARFVATLDTMTDPFLRQACRRLLADEVLHGRFGFYYLESWRGWLAKRPEVVASVERFLKHAFAVIEKELVPTGPFPNLTEDEIALGANDPGLAREVFYNTMQHAILPGIERFGIGAAVAWNTRGS